MSSPTRSPQWLMVVSAMAILVTGLGGLFTLPWALIAGLWTFSTKEYADFASVVTVAVLLMGTPVFALRAALGGRMRLALIATVPALILYGVLLVTSSRS